MASGGTATITLPAQAQATANNTVPAPFLGGGQADVSSYASMGASAVIDPRVVAITSPTIEDSFFAGPGTSPYPRLLHLRASDGSIVTDSAVEATPDQSGWIRGAVLQALVLNFNNPFYTWSLSGAGTLTPNNPDNIQPYYIYGDPSQAGIELNLPVTGSNSLGQQSTITANVKDDDGAEGVNTYTIKWHYPAENWVNYANGEPYWQPADPVSIDPPQYALHDGSVRGTWSYTDTTGDDVVNMFVNIGGNMSPNPFFAGLITVIGLYYNQTQPQQTIQSVVFNDAWYSEHSTFDPAPGDNSAYTQEGYRMQTPTMWVQYKAQFYHGDGYDIHGYTGQVNEQVNKFMGHVDLAGDFVLIQAPPPGG